MKRMRAVVTGATGLLGGNLVARLSQEGHHVRAMCRDVRRAAHLKEFSAEWIVADLCDARALDDAFRDVGVVFHCAASMRLGTAAEMTAGDLEALRRANVDATVCVARAAQRARARLVHCSTVSTIGVSEDGAPCVESMTWNMPAPSEYTLSKRRAEEVVYETIREGLDAVIVNPAFMLGPYDAKPSSGRIIVDIAEKRRFTWPHRRDNIVDVRDVAKGMQLAAEKGRVGQRYILGGENLFFDEVRKRIAGAVGVSSDARDASADEHGLDFVYSSEKARRELGYTWRPVEDGIADAVDWFRRSGRLGQRA
jgi:dihydroflavonol-4-reductase